MIPATRLPNSGAVSRSPGRIPSTLASEGDRAIAPLHQPAPFTPFRVAGLLLLGIWPVPTHTPLRCMASANRSCTVASLSPLMMALSLKPTNTLSFHRWPALGRPSSPLTRGALLGGRLAQEH